MPRVNIPLLVGLCGSSPPSPLPAAGKMGKVQELLQPWASALELYVGPPLGDWNGTLPLWGVPKPRSEILLPRLIWNRFERVAHFCISEKLQSTLWINFRCPVLLVYIKISFWWKCFRLFVYSIQLLFLFQDFFINYSTFNLIL